ncbi:hypothetical protein P167DRAFT_576915 [Morchella conica CCBAS932]|uniref:C2H2-type domain-containing protein n=1 Tax=Morchella conica CCBAS932 TaxID=1392247 RepID=A0A3N4KH13_9PEZI|nr:hypothetical protein P167DRAFT_576915 [Morchella conica CCBAS932]
MASESCTASRLQTLPESLQQHADFIKPLMKPLIANLSTTFNFDDQNIESVPFVDRYFLPSEARASLVQEISKCIENYLNYNTYDDFNPGYSVMGRFVNEDPRDGPWAPGLTQKDNHGDDMGASTSKNLIQQAAKVVGAEGFGWGADLGMRVSERSREQNGDAFLEQRMESTHRIITQGGTAFLDPRRGLVSKAMSTTGVTDQHIHANTIKPRGCSSYIDGSTKPRQSKRRASPGNNGKGLSTTGAGTLNRVHSTSAGSVKSARREAKKQHKCPDCDEVFPFEARLKSHQAVHSKTKCKCHVCDSLFGRDSSLKRHLNTPGACEKKKITKLRNQSFQNSPTATRAGSQHNYNNNYELDATASTSSLVDGNSVNSSPLDTRQPTQNFGQHPNYSLGYISQSPNSHSANYGSAYQNLSPQRPEGWSLDPLAYWDCNTFSFS